MTFDALQNEFDKIRRERDGISKKLPLYDELTEKMDRIRKQIEDKRKQR